MYISVGMLRDVLTWVTNNNDIKYRVVIYRQKKLFAKISGIECLNSQIKLECRIIVLSKNTNHHFNSFLTRKCK